MPISYSIDANRRLVLTRCWGVLTDAELLEHKEQLAKDPAFCPTMGQLSDVRAVERLAVTTEGVKLLVAHDSANAERIGGHRMALVVASDEVFGMARMYSQRSGSPEGVGVFRSIPEAESWLAASGQAADDGN
jgi:hypothetical protein